MHSLQSKSKRTRHLLTALGILVLTVAATVHAAERHLKLVRSTPANAAKVARSPERILLTFSQKANLGLTRVVVTDHLGKTVAVKAPVRADTSGKVVATELPLLPQGSYHVSWRTLARDGHPVAGRFWFTIDTTSAARPRTARR